MRARGPWRDAPDDVDPVVLILGGFLTAPPLYRPMRQRLLRRGAAAVVVANVWTPDWLLAGAVGLGPILDRAARALRAAVRTAAASDRAKGAPVLVIGHSAGGMVGRVLTATEPFDGRRYAAAPAMGGLVTLGTPHHVGERHELGRRVGVAAAQFANRVVPGAAFAPATGYLTVASRAIVGRPDGDGHARVADRLYRGLIGAGTDGAGTDGDTTSGSPIDGDGLVPVQSALLTGATQLILGDIVHGQLAGRPWYGTDQGIEQWWPLALEIWHAALSHRATGPSIPG